MGDAFGSKPNPVNAEGSTLSSNDVKTLFGTNSLGNPEVGFSGAGAMDPVKRLQMFQNWLTAGGPPKPVDPGQIFAEEGTVAAETERAGAGAGFAGLFGFGNMIGSIAPLNTSPMQPGVPYAAPPVPSGPPDVSGRK